MVVNIPEQERMGPLLFWYVMASANSLSYFQYRFLFFDSLSTSKPSTHYVHSRCRYFHLPVQTAERQEKKSSVLALYWQYLSPCPPHQDLEFPRAPCDNFMTSHKLMRAQWWLLLNFLRIYSIFWYSHNGKWKKESSRDFSLFFPLTNEFSVSRTTSTTRKPACKWKSWHSIVDLWFPSSGSCTLSYANTFFVNHSSYVGNLDRRCTEQFVKDIFSKCGKVVRCKMINAVGIICCMFFQLCFTCKKCRPALSIVYD